MLFTVEHEGRTFSFHALKARIGYRKHDTHESGWYWVNKEYKTRSQTFYTLDSCKHYAEKWVRTVLAEEQQRVTKEGV